MNDATPPDDEERPAGYVQVVVECGGGYAYRLFIVPAVGEIAICDDVDGEPNMILCNRKSWLALREAVDSLLRVHDLAVDAFLGSEQGEGTSTAGKPLPSILHYALSGFGVTDFSPASIARIDIAGLRRSGNFGPARELALREWLEHNGQADALANWPPFKMPNSYKGRKRQW